MSESAGRKPVQLGDEFIQDPHALYRRLRPGDSACPVLLPNGFPGWLVSSYEDARGLLADPRLSTDVGRATRIFPPDKARGYGMRPMANMLTTDPPDHTRLRHLVNKAFTPQAVERLRPRIEQAADDLLDVIEPDSPVDLLDAYAVPLPIIVMCELLGIPGTAWADFRAWLQAFVTISAPEQLAEAGRHLTAYLSRLLYIKRAYPAGDLLSELVQVRDKSGRLSPGEIVSMAFLLLVAGFETTVNLIANGVLALLCHLDQLALLQSRPSLLPDTIEEVLRFDGPAHIATVRFTTEAVRAGETEIPADQLVHVSLLAANRDGGRFPDPDRFDITRHGADHVAFGHGIHHCVGASLARLEGQIAIGRLLARFPGTVLDGDPATLRWRSSTLMHGLTSLPVRLSS